MTTDEKIICQGFKDKDCKPIWDGSFPRFEPTKKGWLVHINKKSTLQGIFTNETIARRRYAVYKGKGISAKEQEEE